MTLEWVFGGMESDAPAAGKPTLDVLYETFVAQGMQPVVAKRMAEAAYAASGQEGDSDDSESDDLQGPAKEAATTGALRLAYATIGGRLRLSHLKAKAGPTAKAKYQALYAPALHRGRLVEVELRSVGDRDGGDYEGAIAGWRTERVDAYAGLVGQLDPGETGAFLVWGDPGLYDGTLSILDDVRALDGPPFTTEVMPGISAPAALAARHGVALNRPGEAIQLTTGRRLTREGWPAGVDNVVVLLDSHDALLGLDDDLRVWWGAYLGLPGERLVAGRLGDERERIGHERARGRAHHGWLFDTYLLRRPR